MSYQLSGLSESVASDRLKGEGFNELTKEKRSGMAQMAEEILKEPMFLLLIACGMIYLFLGDIHEAMMLLFAVFVVIGITLYQERKTERALEALRDLSSPRSLVIRDGQQKRIAGREVVREDIVIISEGDRVPADAVLIDANNLTIDESLLTGESLPVRKSEDGKGNDKCIFAGTLLTSGNGVAKVGAIGMNTEMGKIGKSLESVETEKTNLQKETSLIVRNFALYGLVLCAIIIILYGITRTNWIEGFLVGITLAMSVIPEEFPVVLTIFLALGAWRMSKKNVLARRQQAIQALGSVTVLCTDKTGTLTQNKMVVKKLYNGKDFLEVGNEMPESFAEIIEFGVLSSQRDPYDPMEKAIREFSEKAIPGRIVEHEKWKMVKEYPLSKHMLSISHAWRHGESSDMLIAAKGAPEVIMELCHLSTERENELHKKVHEMSESGMRVIGVAKSVTKKIPESQHDFDFQFLGFIGLEDPIRLSVPSAIKECQEAGVRVIMITGDHPGTAKNIANQIGLPEGEIMTGHQISEISDDDLKNRIEKINIFARVVPDQKLRIVNALKENGEIVAMTGDGVNDAPALKSANVGVAMGARGTDVAREASSIVLLDDDFSSIVGGIRMGRRIFDNIRKAMSYVVAVHVPIAGMTLLAVLAGWPLLLLPLHIVLLELIIDPACSFVFEAQKEEGNVMKRKPRDPKEKILSRNYVIASFLQGFVALAAVATVFWLSLLAGKSDIDARAIGFVTLVSANLLLIITSLSWTGSIFSTIKNGSKALILILSGVLALMAIILTVPFTREILKLGTIDYNGIVMTLSALALCVFSFEIIKFVLFRFSQNVSR